ncbi:MAG: ABC transporter ATP-binding protein [Polyangiaceae bacterium]|nr:ABC transporter ATP-binding protein [Polyangiaceae bacterium]
MLYALQNLSKSFHTPAGIVEALTEVSVTVADGEMIAVVGPSGSGKSTLLGILGLLDAEFTGDLEMRGRSIRGMSNRQRARTRLAEVGLIFQSFHLLPALDVRHNVALPHWKLHGNEKRALDRADGLLGELGLAERARSDVMQLSGGEMQRVAIARSLINDPAVLLADEPTANLDDANAAAVIALFRRAHARGAAVVVCTHDTELLAEFPRVLRLRRGKLVA